MHSILDVSCIVMHHYHVSHQEWRRLQVHEQQSERQRKDPMQKCLIFAKRANRKVLEDSLSQNTRLVLLGLLKPSLVSLQPTCSRWPRTCTGCAPLTPIGIGVCGALLEPARGSGLPRTKTHLPTPVLSGANFSCFGVEKALPHFLGEGHDVRYIWIMVAVLRGNSI